MPSTEADEADVRLGVQRVHETRRECPFALCFDMISLAALGPNGAKGNREDGSGGCDGQIAGDEEQYVNFAKIQSVPLGHSKKKVRG